MTSQNTPPSPAAELDSQRVQADLMALLAKAAASAPVPQPTVPAETAGSTPQP